MKTPPYFPCKLLAVLMCTFQAFISAAQTYQVGHISATFVDAGRSNRSVPVEIYYPADVAGDNVPFSPALTGKAPVLSFGHGFVMTYDAYANIRDSVVANGYIIAFPTTEGSFSPVHAEFGRDLAFVLHEVSALGSASSSVLFGKVDTFNCIMGHSMGGGAAYLGIAYDPSIKAVVTFAAAETTPSAISAAASVTAPALVFAGENDCVSPAATNQQPMYDALASGCKHYINISGGSHCQMGGTSVTCSFGEATCTPAPAISRAAQHATINKYLIPWLNYTLKGDCVAGSNLETALATDVAVTFAKNCTLCSTTSLLQAKGSNNIAVYPNPCTDNIIFELPQSHTSSISLYTPAGSKVTEATGNGTTMLPTANLAPGLYFYRIEGGTAPVLRGVIVVNR